MRKYPLVRLLCVLLVTVPPAASGQDSTLLTIDRIFASQEFRAESFGGVRWVEEGAAYTRLERSTTLPDGRDLIRYGTVDGKRSVTVPAEDLIPSGFGSPLSVQDYQWSGDRKRLLVFTNTKRVWRLNTRGDYWVLTLADRSLKKLGGNARESTLMFAKFSPDGTKVAYVRENDLYAEEIETGTITRLTADGSQKVINGTSDWMNEEEFYLRDGFRWSPDGKRIAYWQFDAAGVRDFLMINNTDSLYSFVIPVQYPKVGTTLSACRLGVVAADGGPTTWMQLEGNPRENYIPVMEWAAGPEEIVFQYLNRLQNTLQLMLGDARTGAVRSIYQTRDKAWVDVVTDFRWLDEGKRFCWVSEVDGWRHVYVCSRDGDDQLLVTPGKFDVVSVDAVDERGGWIYFTASPDDATSRYLYRSRLDRSAEAVRLTPPALPGSHEYDVAPGARYAFHTYSRLDTPPVTELVELPSHKVIRTMVDNAKLKSRLASLKRSPVSFFQVEITGDLSADGWSLRPPDFDPARKYPVLVYVYGEPAGQTTQDRWAGDGYLWHLLLAQKGYIVMSFDNRGTPSPRGREWRKCVYGKIGILASEDQSEAIRRVRLWPFVDSTRIGVWGWSGGGSMTLNLMFRHPALYHTGMSVAPVSDQRLYDAAYQECYMGLPSDNEEGFRLGSPVTFAGGLQGNLLIVHGTGDDNVHYQSTERVVNALIRAKKDFTMMAYPNRSHGIHEGEGTTPHLYGLLTRYLMEHLPAGPRQ